MRTVTARGVVGALAVARIAIGLAFAVAPRRLAGGDSSSDESDLIARSFAVREIALGVGGLTAVRGDADAHRLQLWAGLGAFVDVGDLAAALADRGSGNGIPALLATVGLSAETWAFSTARRELVGRSLPAD